MSRLKSNVSRRLWRWPMSEALPKACEWCGLPFALPAEAPHKRFCCRDHRDLWHGKWRQWERAQARLSPRPPGPMKDWTWEGMPEEWDPAETTAEDTSA